LQTLKKIGIVLLADSKYFHHLQTSKQINIHKFCFATFFRQESNARKTTF
jgi:hypothetical protein